MSFTFSTVIVKDCVTEVPLLSVAVITTSLLLSFPTSSFVGVPFNRPVDALNVNQLGMVVPVNIH